MRRKLSENIKRKKISVSIHPDIYNLWINYCVENGIENYSDYIEKLIKEKIKKGSEKI